MASSAEVLEDGMIRRNLALKYRKGVGHKRGADNRAHRFDNGSHALTQSIVKDGAAIRAADGVSSSVHPVMPRRSSAVAVAFPVFRVRVAGDSAPTRGGANDLSTNLIEMAVVAALLRASLRNNCGATIIVKKFG